jgi:hypothetical protein
MQDLPNDGAFALEEVRKNPADYSICIHAATAITRLRENKGGGLHWREPTADQIVTQYVGFAYPGNQRVSKWRVIVSAANHLSHRQNGDVIHT